MPFSLYHASVGAYLQVLPSVAGLVAKAEAHCKEHGLPDEALTGVSMAPDMWPFAKQITSAAQHSAGAIAGLRAGVFGPDRSPAPTDFASLHKVIADALATIESIDPAEINAMEGRDMHFQIGDRRMEFFAEDFILSFSVPNFYFHSAAAYNVLRSQGLNVGKGDFLGKLRMKA